MGCFVTALGLIFIDFPLVFKAFREHELFSKNITSRAVLSPTWPILHRLWPPKCVQNGSQNGLQNGSQITLNRSFWLSQGLPEAYTERVKKRSRKNSPKRCEKGAQNGPRQRSKERPVPDCGQGRSMGGPGEALGGFWKHFGWVFGVILVRFLLTLGREHSGIIFGPKKKTRKTNA